MDSVRDVELRIALSKLDGSVTVSAYGMTAGPDGQWKLVGTVESSRSSELLSAVSTWWASALLELLSADQPSSAPAG